AWRETHHWTTNLVVRFLDDDHAEGVCDVNCTGADPQDVMQIVAATYTDRYERRDGRWGSARRHVEMFYFSQVPGVDLVPPTYGCRAGAACRSGHRMSAGRPWPGPGPRAL